jgi:8-oxo-dGTP diphosphatase
MSETTKTTTVTVTHCKQCPHFDFVFRHNWRDHDSFLCKASGKWLQYNIWRIHEDCPLKDARLPGVMVGVSVFLVNDNKQILVGKRKNANGEGCWGLPGGGMDAGETPRQSAAREAKEETGVIIDPDGIQFATFTNDIFLEESGEHWITLYFISRAYKGEPKIMEPHKCEEWRWVDLDDIPKPVFCDWAKNIDKLKAIIL